MGRVVEKQVYSVAIVGGGAAGLAAAIVAARIMRQHINNTIPTSCACDVALFEADERVGRSILATGNGRCNFSNAVIDTSVYRHSAFVADVLTALEALEDGTNLVLDTPGAIKTNSGIGVAIDTGGDTIHNCPNAVLRFFSNCGLLWRETTQGRLLPVTNKASTVLDVLRAAAHSVGVRELCNAHIVALDPPHSASGHFTLRRQDGSFERAHAVILALGGRTGTELIPVKVPVRAFSPVLGPLRTKTKDIRALDNIRVQCAIELRRPLVQAAGAGGFNRVTQSHLGSYKTTVVARELGEVLFRSYGISGIAVYNISRLAHPGDIVALDLLAGVSVEGAEGFLKKRYRDLGSYGFATTYGDLLRGVMLPRVAEAVCNKCGLDCDSVPNDEGLVRLARTVQSFELVVEGIGDARQCQVHRGGVDVAALDPHTMGVQEIPGLFVAGEAVDVDAPCGGYNLHWAWASGLLAGVSAARKVLAAVTCVHK